MAGHVLGNKVGRIDMSNPQSPEPARWILEMFAPDIPAWNRAFNELERKPLSALEDMLVHSFDRYLRRKGYLTKKQVEVLQGIARKHNVPLPPIPPIAHHAESSHAKQEASAVLRDMRTLTTSSNRLEPEKADVVARWRLWGVAENIIQRAIIQRAHVRETRRVEEWITIPNYAYPMPRLPDIEARSWGVAKSIDYEGTIYVKATIRKDKIAEIDRWLYRYEYYRPRITIETRTYELIEEIANMMHTAVTIIHPYDHRLRKRVISYRTSVSGARAVRVAYLMEPHLKHPEKKRMAKEILEIYKESPEIKIA